jgi:hypothetical protein
MGRMTTSAPTAPAPEASIEGGKAGKRWRRYTVVLFADEWPRLESMARDQVREPAQQIAFAVRESLARWEWAKHTRPQPERADAG